MAKKTKKRKSAKRRPVKANAPKLKRKAPKGWVAARAVKIRRVGGRVEVLIRK